MKDFALPLIAVAMFLCGALAASPPQSHADLRSAMKVIAADNTELRAVSKTLRNRCPARPRLQTNIPFAPGEPI